MIIHFFKDRVSELLRWSDGEARDCVSYLLRAVPGIALDGDEDSASARWSEEFAADNIGLNMVIHTAADDRGRVFALWAAETLFATLDLVEKYAYARQLVSSSQVPDHPYSVLRLKYLRSAIAESTPKGILVVGQALEAMAAKILESTGA